MHFLTQPYRSVSDFILFRVARAWRYIHLILCSDYPIIIWALHRLGAIATYVQLSTFWSRLSRFEILFLFLIRTANPNYTAHELSYQLSLTKSFLLFTCSSPKHLEITLESINIYKSITRKNVILLSPDSENESNTRGKEDGEEFWTVEKMIQYGVSRQKLFVERRLDPEEGKRKVALLCFSSGTTGRPKVCPDNFASRGLLFEQRKFRRSRFHTMPSSLTRCRCPSFIW